jgi:hypothetical protein
MKKIARHLGTYDLILEYEDQVKPGTEVTILDPILHKEFQGNPYFDLYQDIFGKKYEPFMSFGDPNKLISRVKDQWTMRQLWTHKFAFAIPNPEAIACIRKYLPILEIGAGSGYWARMVTEKWSDPSYYAYDNFTTHTFPEYYYDVRDELERLPNRTLFFCWPPYDDPMAADFLKGYKPTTVIYVGEWGGCTADSKFHDLLSDNYEEIEQVNIPQYDGIHDRLWVFKLKGNDAN